MTDATNLEVALSLARAGWYVFPVRMPEKRPTVLWNDAATTDERTIYEWWSLDPDHGVGYHTGRSGLVGVDIDEKGGISGSKNLAAAGLELDWAVDGHPDALAYATPSGGEHWIYAAPEGRNLTIAQGHPVPGVDIRAGNGFLIYYGKPLKKRPNLPPAPEWALLDIDVKPSHRNGSADEQLYRNRLNRGKPDKAVREALKVVTPSGMSHGDMLTAITTLVQLGQSGHPGVADALDAARDTYAQGWPEADRHWDNALLGSIKRIGLPPLTLDIPKPERKAIIQRNTPEAVREAKTERKAVRAVARIQRGDGEITHSAIAEAIAQTIDGEWINTPGLGLLRYNGVIWQPAPMDLLVNRCRLILRVIRAEETRDAIMRGDVKAEIEAKTLERYSTARDIAKFVFGILLETPPQLDADPDLLNCPNGVVDLRTGELREHRASDHFTKVAGAEYNPDADDRDWRRALKAIPKGTRRWLQVRLGQSAIGRISSDKSVPFLLGGGDNGKSTLLGAVRSSLGMYAVTVPERLLLGGENDHPTDMMTLRGARLAVFEELPKGGRLNAQRLKQLSGTNELTGRLMRQDFVTFPATHTLVGATNHLPIITDVDEATWNRVAPVPFPYRFVAGDPRAGTTERRGDRDLRDRLAETPSEAALAWLVRGAMASYQSIPDKPKAVAERLREWRGEADPVLVFIRDNLDIAEGYYVTAADLYEEFNRSLERRNQSRWSDQLIAASFSGHSSFDMVTKRQVRASQPIERSKPPLQLLSMRRESDRMMAWVGVRFRSESKILSEAERDAAELASLERRARA